MSIKEEPGCIFDLDTRIYLSTGDWIGKQMQDKGITSTTLALSKETKEEELYSTSYISNIKAGREGIPARLVSQLLDAFNYVGNERKHYMSEFARINLPLELRSVVNSPLRSIKSAMQQEQKRLSTASQFIQSHGDKELIEIEMLNQNIMEKIKHEYFEIFRIAKRKNKGILEAKRKQFIKENDFSIRLISEKCKVKKSWIIENISTLDEEIFEFNNKDALSFLLRSNRYMDNLTIKSKIRTIHKNITPLDIYDLPKSQLTESYNLLKKYAKENSDVINLTGDSLLSLISSEELKHMSFEKIDAYESVPKNIKELKKYISEFNEIEQAYIYEVLSTLAKSSIDMNIDTLDDTLHNLNLITGTDYYEIINSYKSVSENPAIIEEPFYQIFNLLRVRLNSQTIHTDTDTDTDTDTVTVYSIFGLTIEELNSKSNSELLYLNEEAVMNYENIDYDIDNEIFLKYELPSILQNELPILNIDEILATEHIKKSGFGSFLISKILCLI